jgi:hypothetical protein
MAVNFPILRTKRLTLQLKELTIAESIALAKIPPHLEQVAVTQFLTFAVQDAGQFTDISQWTVQERIMAVCHYLSCVVDDAPNFKVGENGYYMDYLDGEKDIKTVDTVLDLGELGGDFWQIRHLKGYMAETIERLDGELNGITGRLHWLLGTMAAQLVRKSEEIPEKFDEDWLLSRMNVMANLSESDFISLSFMHNTGLEKLTHLFAIEFDDSGVLVLPADKEADLPPARFRVHAVLSGFAQRMGAEPEQPSE